MEALGLILFALAWVAGVWAIRHIISRGKFKLDFKQALLYASFMAMLGPLGEVVLGTAYEAIAGFPLWTYQLLPTHEGYTSYYAPVIWAIAGFTLYLAKDLIEKIPRINKTKRRLLFPLEVFIGELLLNASYLVIFGGYLFYYTPGDIAHLSSLQTLPFYFIAGLIALSTLKRVNTHPYFFTCMFLAIMGSFVFLVG